MKITLEPPHKAWHPGFGTGCLQNIVFLWDSGGACRNLWGWTGAQEERYETLGN